MEQEAEKLLYEFSKMNNVYGFCARHYIKDENAEKFLMEVNNAILENKLSIDESTKIMLKNYISKGLESSESMNTMKVNDLKNI
jgi:hypothetical protein